MRQIGKVAVNGKRSHIINTQNLRKTNKLQIIRLREHINPVFSLVLFIKTLRAMINTDFYLWKNEMSTRSNAICNLNLPSSTFQQITIYTFTQSIHSHRFVCVQ